MSVYQIRIAGLTGSLLVGALLVGASVGAAAVLWFSGVSRPDGASRHAYVTVVNDSSLPISELTIEHEYGSVAHHGLRREGAMREVQALHAGESIVLSVYCPGENSYRIRAELSDGTVVEGGTGYIEPGYDTEERVTEQGITSTTVSLY